MSSTRSRWSSRTIFLFAAIGSAVGLGNIWRFPYLTYKFGGGAFLIPYLIALLVLGIPLLILEFAIGQKMQHGAVDSFAKISKRLSGIGYGALFAAFIVVVYYAIVMAWSLVYLINSFQSHLPWTADPSGYFFNGVLQISDSVGTLGGINWLLLFALAAIWFIIYLCVKNGVKSVGKVVAITMPLPIILLFVLFFRGITLDGALIGIWYYLTPNFAALLSTEIWIAAASQIFFTLSLAFGIMIAYASYNQENQDILSDAYITSISNSVISIFAGFVVFSVLGYMATTTSVAIEEVVAAGPGLAFVVFPQALSLMPFGSIFAVLFFITLLTLGIDSAFSLIEAVNTSIIDKKLTNQTRTQKSQLIKRISLLVCSIAFLFGIIFTTKAGLYYLDIIDHFVTNFALIMFGILECLAVGWIYGAKNLRNYINSTSKHKIGVWWDISIKYLIPIILTILIVAQLITETIAPYEGYPAWAILIGWLSVALPLLFVAIPLFFTKENLINNTKDKNLKDKNQNIQLEDSRKTAKSTNAGESIAKKDSNDILNSNLNSNLNAKSNALNKSDSTNSPVKIPNESSPANFTADDKLAASSDLRIGSEDIAQRSMHQADDDAARTITEDTINLTQQTDNTKSATKVQRINDDIENLIANELNEGLDQATSNPLSKGNKIESKTNNIKKSGTLQSKNKSKKKEIKNEIKKPIKKSSNKKENAPKISQLKKKKNDHGSNLKKPIKKNIKLKTNKSKRIKEVKKVKLVKTVNKKKNSSK